MFLYYVYQIMSSSAVESFTNKSVQAETPRAVQALEQRISDERVRQYLSTCCDHRTISSMAATGHAKHLHQYPRMYVYCNVPFNILSDQYFACMSEYLRASALPGSLQDTVSMIYAVRCHLANYSQRVARTSHQLASAHKQRPTGGDSTITILLF